MIKIIYYNLYQTTMIRPLQIISLLACITLSVSISGVGLNPIRPMHLNKGQSTKYMFYINPQTSISSNAQLQITFPMEFDQTAIASQLGCLASTPSYSWKTVPCAYSNGVIVISLNVINNEQLNILISQVTNPSIYSMSSFFKVCLAVSNMISSCSFTFGKVIFPTAPTTTPSNTSYPTVASLNTLIVGQSSTYQFQFSFTKSYNVTGNSIRVTFPVGFQTSNTPSCQMNGTYTQEITTFVWPDQRTVECQNISKTLGQNESLKIIGIFNPGFAGTFSGSNNNGFKIEVMQSTTTIVLQQIDVQAGVTIAAGTLKGYISQANNFIQGDVVYTFYLNILNSLTANNFIIITFDNTWLLYSGRCAAISGITLNPNSALRCTNSTTASDTILNVSNFASASVSNQLVFSITVRSPPINKTYPVGIRTASILGTVDSMTTSVTLNQTYGDYSMLSINAIVAQSDVPVSGTGPLELTFFLNYELPQTNVLTYGKFVIKIYPQIPLPPVSTNGVLKCYFFNTIPAQTCVWDTTTSPSYTLLTINTPITMAYQYSEIPITITTEGAVSTSKIGITIADIVTRYRFELQAYKQTNATTPTEVYFSEYIAAPISLPLTTYSLTKEVNQFTHLRFQFTSPYNFTPPLAGDLRIKIEFLGGGAWAANLGYSANTIYKRFPCVFSDNKLQTLPPQYNADVTCDFYTYLTGPHASLTKESVRGPYILVGGFTNQMYINNQVRLELGKFLIGPATNLAAKIRFSLVQQTPSMLTKYVELYYNQFAAFTTTTQAIPAAGSGILTDVITNPQINAVSNHRLTYTAPSSFFAVMYQFDKISTPSFPNQFVECTIGTAPAINWCTMLGYPSNYIVEYRYSGNFPTSVASVLNITNGVYSGTFVGTAQLYSSGSVTVYKQNFNVVYNPYPITGGNARIWMDTGTIDTLYKGSQIYYYVDHYPTYSTPDNGFIRLIFGNNFQLGQFPYCQSNDLTPLVPELGLVCTYQSTTSLKISNILGLVGGNFYRIRVRLITVIASTSGVNVAPTVTIQNHYSVNADPSIVNSITNSALNPTQNNTYTMPNQFRIPNPRVAFQTPRVNYVGKFEVYFTPTADVLTAYQIKLVLSSHAWNGGFWKTPGNSADPMVCLINYVRVPCSFTLSPLTVTMFVSPAGITASQNNIITLDTEYLTTYNGIVHPTQGGQYICYMQFLTSSAAIIQQQSFYHKVLPPKLGNFEVFTSCNDVGAQNMFQIRFEIGGTHFNANNHGTTYSRIYIEFPTVDSNGNALFANNLGGYSATGEMVGCAFNTWDSWFVSSATGRLMCRLIMSQVPGDPVRVQIINHNYFDNNYRYMQLWIAKVFNPANPVTSIPISIKIDHVSVSTNDVYQLYYDTYDVFMNSQTPTPSYTLNEDCQSGAYCSSCTIFSSNIYNRNWFRFSPYIAGSPTMSLGYYYVLDTTKMFIPNTLQNQVNNNNCHGSYYYLCLAFPDINYFIIQVKSTSRYYVQMYLTAGAAISQYTTNLVAKMWSNKRYIGTHTIQLSPTCWNQLIGSFNSVGISSIASSSYDAYLNKRRFQVQVTFTTTYSIPATGSIIVVWPSTIPRIYPHCRSMTNLGSTLYAQGTSYNGQVGCLVQNTRHWVITGFNALSGGSAVVIVGQIDLPSSSSWIGAGEIISFNNTHASNIRANGFIIDYFYSSTFGINVNNAQSQNVDSQIIMEETLPLRVNYVGPLRFKFQLASSFTGPNAGLITVRLPQVSTMGVAGGFTYASSKKHVCQIVQISNYEETGCIITNIATDSNAVFPNFIFTMVTSTSLVSGVLYKLVLTTATGVQPEGLTFPTVAGTYKVDFNFDTTGSTNYALHNHLYAQVYGTKFAYLNLIAFCTCPNYKNLIWLKLTPTTTIQTTQQLVIEIPTKAANGDLLFANDVGMGYTDGQSIPYDMQNTVFSQTFMNCRFFLGDQTNGKPAKIVCGQFASTITSSQILWFAFFIKNPSSGSISTQVSIPFFIYSQQLGTTYKTNFDVIENAVYIRNDVYTKTDSFSIASQNGQLQTSGTYIEMITRNYWTIGSGDYYVVLFNFPLRVNGLVSSGCVEPGSTAYGNAYYHQNLWAIVCAVSGSNSIGVPTGASPSRNLRITGFYTPFYYLASGEKTVVTYSYYFSGKITSIGFSDDGGYPNEAPKIPSSPSLTFAPAHESTIYAGVRDDYTITFTYTTSASVDISYTQLIAFIFPSGIDFAYPESDCLQSPSSQVQISKCLIDTSNGVIWITPVVKTTYTSNMAISIITRNLAIRNPVSNYITNKYSFVVKYYSWQNISQPGLSPLSNDNYCFLKINNFPNSGITYNFNPNPYQVPTFSYINYPHQRYYQETPFSSLTHRAPFEMQFAPTITFTGQSGSNYHQIMIVYPSSFGDADLVKIRDLQVFKPVCYLNNQRIKLCEISTGSNHMVMSFLFGLTAGTKYHIKFSIIDPRNADIDGFLSSAAVSNVVLMYKPYGGVWYYTETDQFPSLYSLPTGTTAGPFRGIIAGAADYGHRVPSQLNYVNLLLTFNRTDITGLVFEIPSVDGNGNALFSSQANLKTTFMSQQNGGSYPCGNNGLGAGGAAQCILLSGDFSNSGVPTRIVMTGFTYQSQMNCRLVFINPSSTGVYFSVIVRAFGGTPTALNPYGNQYMGFWEFNEIFQVYTSTTTVYTGSYTTNNHVCPNQSPWRNNTIFPVVSRDQLIGSGQTSIATIKTYDSSSSTVDDLFCEATLNPTNSYDDLLQYTLVSGGVTTTYAYFITTWPSNANLSYTASGWGLSYLKCKYFAALSITASFFYSDTTIEVAPQSFSSSYCNGWTGSSPVSKYFSQSYFVADGTDTDLVHQFDYTPPLGVSNFGFRSGDAMVLAVSYENNPWGTISSCSLLGGIASTSENQIAYCNVASNTKVYIVNVGGFVANPLLATSTAYRVKIKFTSTGLTTTANNDDFYFYTALYANYDAYTNGYQPILNRYNNLISASTPCTHSQPGACYISQSGAPRGTFQVQAVTDTFMRVAFSPNANLDFSTSTSYGHHFIINTNGFNYGPSCTISKVVYEYSSSSTPGSGTNNTVLPTTISCTSNRLYIALTGQAFANYWGGLPSAGLWNPGTFIILYITISPDPVSRDLPSLHHEYIFIAGSYNYYISGDYYLRAQGTVTLPSQPLASGASISTLSNNVGGPTQFSFQLSSANLNFGPQNTGYMLLLQFVSTSGWTGNNDPFSSYTNTALSVDSVACKCIAGTSPLIVSAASPIVDASCLRRIPNGTYNNYAILIDANVQQTQDLICFLPEFKIPTSTSFSVEFKLIYGNSFPPELTTTTTKYSSMYRVTSNTLTFTTTPTTSLPGFNTLTETPDFYAQATNIGSTLSGSYSLYGSWSLGISTPYIYINFQSAGPIPISQFCSNLNTFSQCRVYSNPIYLVVAQMKAASVTSFNITNSGVSLQYPPSQTSLSNYGAKIYVGLGSWQYSATISRSQSSLTPISTNTFNAFPDKYGSNKASYAALVFFVFNPAGQYLYSNVKTGSKLVISWSSLTTTSNCQVWVQGQPLVNLNCAYASNSLTITSPYFDYATTSNIIISIGMTNPTSASVTFTANLYSYFYSGSRYSLTISRTTAYTTDTTYTSYSLVAKSTVDMYPFQARISTVPNAPQRIRFVLPSSSVAITNGRLYFSNTQISYSSSHLCYIIKYSSYAAMMQQTQRNVYKVYSCSSSGTTLTIRPPYTLTLTPSNYYELVMMPLTISTLGCNIYGCVSKSGYQQSANFDSVSFSAYNNVNTPSIISQQVNNQYKYEGATFIGLQQIYVLCTQPKITSIHLSISINFTSTNNYPNHYLQITLYDLTINAFPGYAIGDIFPCQLSSNFLTISLRNNPQCRVVSADLLNSFVAVRIQNIGNLSPQIYWISLDDILLPTPSQSDNNNKFDVGVGYYGPSNTKYWNYFPEIFQVDNTNQTGPVTSTPFTFNNPGITGFGNVIVGQITFNWPYDTTGAGYESKIALNFNGGYSAVWPNIDTITFLDATVGTYQILWVNKKLNKFVFLVPSKANAVSTTLNITGLVNPYPYQRELYNFNSTNVIVNFYNNFFLANKQTFAQPAFSIFTMNLPLIFINQNLPSNTIDNYPSTNTFAPASLNILTLSVNFDENAANILLRNLGNIKVQFTSGVTSIRECRAMRNTSLFINTAQVCQPSWDGTYWSVMLYDVVNSQVGTGWWIQIFATFNTATLSYTSYVMATNNLVVEYQASYTVSMSGYNAARAVPTKLSWLNNKYVSYFHEMQYKYLQAVSGQTTQYIKFRFAPPITSSSSSDVYYIYLPDNSAGQPFTPVTSNSHVVCQFLPSLSAGDSDFSVGKAADCTLTDNGSIKYYSCQLRLGGLVGGADYLIQLSEYNTATSSFYMPTSPGRQQVQFLYQYYPSVHDWRYYESVFVYYYRFFKSAQFLHTTTTINDYETITINYTPDGSLSAASSNNEIALRLSVQTRYHLADGGITDIYTADSMSIISGSQYSGVVSNPNGGEINTIQFGQYSIQNAPLRFTLAKQSAYSDNVAYYWMVPLLKNPSATFVTLRFNLTLVNSPASSYQYIFNHYQSLNEYYTVGDTSTSFSTSITNSLRSVQTVSAVDLSVSLGTYSLSQWNTAIFKINNALPGLIQSIATPNDTTNYNYYYFKIINMVMAQKKSLNQITNIGIGSSSSTINYQSTFGLSWVRVFSNSNVPQATNPYTLQYSTPATLTLNYLTNYASASVTLKEGYQVQGSTAMYKVTFTTPIIPEGGQIRIVFSNSTFSSNNLGLCRVYTNFAKSSNANSVLRCYRVSEGYRISGFSGISASTTVSAYIMVTSVSSATASPIQVDVFGIYQDNTTRISLAQVGSITHSAGSVLPVQYRYLSTVIPYFSTIHTNNYYMIEGAFNLRITTLLNGDYIYISEPGWNIGSGGVRRLLIKQNSSSVTGWTELAGAYISTNYYRYTLPTNYLMTQSATFGVQYLFRYNIYTAYPNGFIAGGPGVSRFWITTVHSGTTQQVGYHDFVPYPQPYGLTINNRYTAAGRQTVLDLSWTSNIDIYSGDKLVITLDTNNLLYNMFANDLQGVGTSGATAYRYLDCRQWYNNNQISNSRIVCLLSYGNNLANPPIPANLTISFTKNCYGYSSSTGIRLLIANVMNPTTVGLNTGISLNVLSSCQNQRNQPCSKYQARGYYVTSSNAQNLRTTGTSFSSTSPLVLTTGLTHTFNLTLVTSIGVNDAIYIIYPQNFQGVMPSDCSVSSYYCYVFPTRRWVVLYPMATVSAGPISLAITPMNNPYYAQPASLYFLVTVARPGSTGDTYKILQDPFTPVSYSLQNTSAATAITVAPTQTPNMYLRNYANTVYFTISNLFSDKRMQAIYIEAPSEVVSWDGTYCNASITNTASFNYPLRFTCIVDPLTPQFLRLTLDSDMPTYSPAWGTMSILLRAKFTLADFPSAPTLYVSMPVSSGSFFAYGSVSPSTSSSLYYVSKCSVTISISQHQVPIISVINFNTQSFADRLARVNNKQVFYLLFKPLPNNITIGSIVFTIPSQFNYPGVFQFDNCLLIGRTTINQPNCQLSRSQGQTLVTIVPTFYDNQVKIIQIGTVSQANWFTAPPLPGNFYNMNVAVYSPTGALIAKQTRNISPVYGSSFDIPSMSIKNIQDANIKLSVYDITFVTGSLQIPPGATTTATTQTSVLQFIFQNFNGMYPTNVFSNDLKTGLKTGDEVGCKVFQGLVALSGMRIKCILTVGVNATYKPIISVINYNFVNPGTTITIGFAGIQSLPPTLVNTISIGVMIYYNDIASSTYLYIPTPILPVSTNATTLMSSYPGGWVLGWQVNASYSGTNIVLKPTILNISFIIPYTYWQNPVSPYNMLWNYVYTSTGASDEFILLTFYPSTLLDKNNPTPVSCTTCTSVDIYYAAGMVRFRHATSTSGTGARAFVFNNFPTSAYAMLNQTVYVYFQIFTSYQAVVSKNVTFNLSRTVEKCTKFTFGVVSVSSLNGGQIGVTYTFSILTNHFVPADGAISITIPSVFGNMIENKATCTLMGFGNTNCYCMINTPYRIDIIANGTELSTTTTYTIQITGLQNPNVDSSNFVLIATSYYVSNIYLGLKICENQIIPPTINIKPLRTCTLSWTPQYYNQNFNTTYVFQLSCSDVFRGDSTLYISLPSAFSANNRIGSYPCSSYDSTALASPTCNLQMINNVLTLTTDIDTSTTSSLSVILNLVNPINNTYFANAYVTSKGTQYASSGNSSLTILSNQYATGKQSDVELLNSPRQAGLMSTYVFKIAPMSSFSPTNLGITFPSNFYIDPTKLRVSIFLNARNNIFSILNYNNIQSLINNSTSIANSYISSYPSFTVPTTGPAANRGVYLTEIGSQVDSKLWTYVFLSNVKNPSAYVHANFTVAYYLVSSGFQSLQWVFQRPLTYYISSPPQYISINSVVVSDLDLLYPANYTFNISASTGTNIAISGMTLSYIIIIPTFYKSTLWANTPPVCKFSELPMASNCSNSQGQIIVTEKFTSNYSSLSLSISSLLNPSLPTSCATTDTAILSQTFFIIQIIDTVSNSYLFESSSVVDSKNCLTFTSLRIPISLEYNLVMKAGLAYNITYGLTKGASNLKITASCPTNGFSFSPATVDFSDYNVLTKSTQLFLRSDVAAGTYTIYFTKSESSVKTDFRNILPITITVSASDSSSLTTLTPTISIPSMVDYTIGYSTIIPIQFSLPSSTQMTLFLTVAEEANQTLSQYSSFLSNFTITPRIINIEPQKTEYKYNVTHRSQLVPPPLTLNFKLTSNYPIVHKLTTPTMYLCFDLDPRYPKENVLYPPLRVTVTPFLTSCNRQDVGKTITNIFISNESSQSSASLVTPKIISMKVNSVASTGAVISINSLSAGTIYYACVLAGSPPILNASVLTANTSQGISGSTQSSALDVNSGKTAQINYIGTVTLTKLTQLTNYVFYAVFQSNLGTSSIKSVNISTTILSKGVKFTMRFTSILQSNLFLVTSLVKSLRVSIGRIKVLTNPYTLQQQAASITSSSNKPVFTYDIVLAPDSNNDIVSPLTTIKNFAQSSTALTGFQSSVPTFIISTKITYFELRPIEPQLTETQDSTNPKIRIVNQYNATFDIRFKTQSNVYVVLIESVGTGKNSLLIAKQITPRTVAQLTAAQAKLAPSSSQIKAGTDSNNTRLGKYKVLQFTTDQYGVGQVVFEDLKENSEYVVYITASSPLPYEPTMLWPDSKVLTFSFATLPNPNVGTAQKQKDSIEQFSKYNPELAAEMMRFVKAREKKQKVQSKK